MSKFHTSLLKQVSSHYGDDDTYDMNDIIIHNSDIVIKKNKMQYLLFDFEKEVSPGKYERVFKAIKLIKLIRIPKKDQSLTYFLNMHSGVIVGWNMQQINYLQICANITKPYKKGLVFAYGVQGISSSSIQEAMHDADIQMAALEKGITGTFKTMEYDDLDAEDARWIFRKMNEMKEMLVVRGIPEAKISQGRATQTLFTTSENKDAEEQSEEFLLGMDEFEYMLVLTATTVSYNTLSLWTDAALKEQSYWASLKNGTKSMTFGLSIPMVYGSNIGASQGWNSGTSKTFGENYSESHSHSTGTSESWSEGTSQTYSFGKSFSKSEGISSSTSFGESIGRGTSLSNSQSSGHSSSEGTSTGSGTSHSNSSSVSDGSSTSQSHSTGTSNSLSNSSSVSNSVSNSESYGTSKGTSLGYGTSTGTSSSTGGSTSWNKGESSNWSEGQSSNWSEGSSTSWNKGGSSSSSHGSSSSTSTSSSDSNSWSKGTSAGIDGGGEILGLKVGANHSRNESMSEGTTTGSGSSNGTSSSTSTGSSWSNGGGTSSSHGGGTSSSYGGGTSTSIGGGTSWSNGVSESVSTSSSVNEGISHSTSVGNTTGTSTGTSISSGTSVSDSMGSGTSHSQSTSVSDGISSSVSHSTSQGVSMSSSSSQGTSTSNSQSTSHSLGTSSSTSQGWSESNSYGTSQGHSVGVSESDTVGESHGYSTSRGITEGVSSGISRGFSGSLGLGPSLSFGKTFQWEDREATRLVDMLQYSLQRFISAQANTGMWFTDCFIITENAEASAAATTLAMSSWHSPNAMISPLQVYQPSPMEREYLLKHLSVFSPSVKKEGIPGQFESYKYSTLLLSNELAAMSHPPRVNVGGIQASIDDPMPLTIPANRQNGEIFLGYVADVEKFSKTHKYKSGFKYCINESELHHAYFSGASRSGKTVAAKRAVAETYNNVRRGEDKKRMRFVIMDPKQDWRALAKVIPPEHFRFYSLADPKFHPIKMNLMKIPEGVYAERYVNTLKEIFVRSFGLGDRGFNILGQAMIDVYNSVGVFDEDVRLNQKDPVTGTYPATERSKLVTLEDVAKRLHEIQEGKTVRGEKQDAIQRILDRMYDFESDASITKEIFCNRGDAGMGIDDLLGDDDVIVLESFGMNMMVSSFIFGLLTSSIYQYAVANGGFISKDQYETVIVIEEANQVLIGEDRDNLGGPNPFEIILDQSAGFGLFIWSITQKIADMPQSILANCAIKVIGRQDRPDDIELSVVQIGKEGKIEDRKWKEWFPDMPQGWFIVKSTRNRDFKLNAPVHVLIEYLDAEPPTNAELDSILRMNSLSVSLLLFFCRII